MPELRIAVIGCGGIGAVHLKSWARVENARVTAACDADRARAEAAGAAAYTDFETLLEREELDAVDICTPPHLHAPVAAAALRRGLATLCEKPLARTPAEAAEIVRAAAEAGAPLMTAFCHRFHPPVEFVRGLIEGGKLGRV